MGCDTTVNPYNNLLSPYAAKEELEQQLRKANEEHWGLKGKVSFELLLEKLLTELKPLLPETVPKYEVWILHRHYDLDKDEVLVSSLVEGRIIVRPMNLKTDDVPPLAEDRWDSSGQPLRYTSDKTVSKPSKDFWDGFKRLTVDRGITMLGVGAAPADSFRLQERSFTTGVQYVLMGKPGTKDRERIVTVEPWSESAFSNGWLSNLHHHNESNYVTEKTIDHRSSLTTSDDGLDYTSDGWLDYAANAPLGRMHHRMHHHMLTQPPQPPNTTAGDNCVNQCGPD